MITDIVCRKCHKRLGKIKILIPVKMKGKDNGISRIVYRDEENYEILCDECAEKEGAKDDHPQRIYHDAPAQLPEDH